MAVEFEEPRFNQPNQYSGSGQGAVMKLIIKLGLARNGTQANVVMLIIAVIAIGLAIYVAFPSRATAPIPRMPTPSRPLTEGEP